MKRSARRTGERGAGGARIVRSRADDDDGDGDDRDASGPSSCRGRRGRTSPRTSKGRVSTPAGGGGRWGGGRGRRRRSARDGDIVSFHDTFSRASTPTNESRDADAEEGKDRRAGARNLARDAPTASRSRLASTSCRRRAGRPRVRRAGAGSSSSSNGYFPRRERTTTTTTGRRRIFRPTFRRPPVRSAGRPHSLRARA